MKFKQYFFLLTLCCFSQTILAGKYSVMGVDDDAVVDSFFLEIQQDLRTDNAKSLSQKIKYPFRVFLVDSRLKLNSAQDFIDNYNTIITPEFKHALLCETIEDLHYGSAGVVVARGLVYLNRLYMGDIKDIPVGRDRSKDDQTLWQLKISKLSSSNFAAIVAKDCLKKRAEETKVK